MNPAFAKQRKQRTELESSPSARGADGIGVVSVDPEPAPRECVGLQRPGAEPETVCEVSAEPEEAPRLRPLEAHSDATRPVDPDRAVEPAVDRLGSRCLIEDNCRP